MNKLPRSLIITIGGLLILVILLSLGISWYESMHSNTAMGSIENTFTVNDCLSVSPTTLNLRVGVAMTIDNKDNSSHVITIGNSNNKVTVPASSSVEFNVDSFAGSSSQSINCDAVTNVASFIVQGSPTTSQNNSTTTTSTTFVEAYNKLSSSAQSCVQGVLGKNFSAAYNKDSISTSTADEIVSACFTPPQSSIPSFKSQFDGMTSVVQACVKTALGENFTSVYSGQQNVNVTEDQASAVNACLRK